MKRIHILSIESTLETQAIRSAAEYWGAVVSVTWVGNSKDIVDYLSAHPPHDLILIAGHGDARGLVLPALDEAIKGEYPFVDVMRPEDFGQFVSLSGSLVVNTSCCGGNPALAGVFLSHGASGYSGADGYPDGDDVLMYTLGFLYHYLVRRESPLESHRNALQFGAGSFVFCPHTS